MAAILAIDQGTTSTRAIVFDVSGEVLAISQRELRQIYPRAGWVEHDPEEIWRATLDTCRDVLDRVPAVEAIGITNQRETTVVWDRDTGEPVHNAIVWQDRRGADHCRRLIDGGAEDMVRERTGLVLDFIFPLPRSRGCWTTYPAHGCGRIGAVLPSARSTAFCSGA